MALLFARVSTVITVLVKSKSCLCFVYCMMSLSNHGYEHVNVISGNE